MLSSLTWMATREKITEFIDGYIADWPRVQVWPGQYYGLTWGQPPMAHQMTSQELAQDLAANAEFRALQLGTWLNRPDVELITAAAEAITPPPYRQDIEVLIEGMKLAAQLQRRDGWNRVAVTAGSAAVMTLLFTGSKS
jgi:hypothetical protein